MELQIRRRMVGKIKSSPKARIIADEQWKAEGETEWPEEDDYLLHIYKIEEI
jgi:hypothetical protein